MKEVLALVRRNMRLFFRDRASVFFSLLSVLIIILLYALFLAKMQVNGITEAITNAGLVPDKDAIRYFVDSWIMGGILATGTVTTSLGAIGILVDDRHRGASRDFQVSPVKRSQLVAGYLLSTFLVSLVMSTIAFVIAEGYIVLSGGELLDAAGMFGTLGVLSLCILAFSALMCFLATFMKTPGAFGSFSTVVGTLLGFFMGIYVPIGVLPESIQVFMKVLPFNSAAVLMRQQFMTKPLARVFAGVPESLSTWYEDFYGISMTLFDHKVPPWAMLAFIGAFGAVFFLLAVLRLNRKMGSK
jgi:multidrug/hemolysin transport system permease protein